MGGKMGNQNDKGWKIHFEKKLMMNFYSMLRELEKLLVY